MNPNISLLNMLCRICGQEDKHCTPVFSINGKKQGIQKKIRACLNLSVEETDVFPKQLCIACLNKLETAWNLSQLCKEGQTLLKMKLNSSGLPTKNNQDRFLSAVEQKLKGLKENEKVLLSGTSLIFLHPPNPAPPEDIAPVVAPMIASSSEMLGAQPAPLLVNSTPIKFMQPPTAPIEQAPTFPAPIPVDDRVYPESLIQVNPTSKPVVYQHMKQIDQSLPSLPRRNIPSPVKRRALKEGKSSNIQPSKRSNQVCRYCNKCFPDDIIDHHVNLHLRQSFITCIECNKNFRSEEAMSRHRCGANDSITLDSDEEEPICL